MNLELLKGLRALIFGPLVPILLFVAACGASVTETPPAEVSTPEAPAAAPSPVSNPQEPAATPQQAQTTQEPVATPQEAQVTQEPVSPGGTLNSGMPEMGKFDGHPFLTSEPRQSVVNLAIGEGAVRIKQDLSATPMLAESWEISDDFLTWTFKMREGVQFHKGYGEMTAEDFVYSQNQLAEAGFHARASFIKDFWNHPEGSVEITDTYTVKVNTGEPWVDGRVFEWMADQGGASSWIVSKKQSEEIGVGAASADIAATGPYQIEEHQTGEFWRMSAVQDHWRQTPYFDELVFWEIPEESARLAGFQTGRLDTFEMSFETIPSVQEVEGAMLMSVPNAGQAGLNLYGQLYVGVGTPEQHPAYNPELAWVSSNPDPASEEWERARKVRQALSISIDREAIVDTLLRGYGSPLPMRDWAGHESRMPPEWQWEFNPERAQELLAEAGYEDGFSITLTPAIRNAPAEVEACEAVASMWGDIGVDVDFQRTPYTTLRPSLISREYVGGTCHSVAIRLVVAIGASNYLNESVFSYGTHHPMLDKLVSTATSEVDPVKRQQLEVDIYQWMSDNVMAFGLYSFNAVWPVGPRIQEWQPSGYADLRKINGYEYIQPR